MSVLDRLAGKLGHTRWFAAVMKRVAPPVDRLLYGRFGGRTLGAGPPTLLLTTVGRKSGRERTVPLLYVRHEGDALAVAASNWGQEHHPAWSENLLANPEARVTVGHETFSCRARLAGADEKAALWPRFVELWPAYDTYQSRSGRDIRVFILEPL